MKNMKRFFCLLTSALLSLALLAGCGSVGGKWRDTIEIDDYGTIIRNGMQIDVCVCHDQKAVYFYYDDEKHELFDKAKLPTDEIYDKDWSLGEISFDDLNDDGNSDLEVYLNHDDMTESHIEWIWEEGAGYVYEPVCSWFYDPIVIYDPPDDSIENDFSVYEGLWLYETTDRSYYLQFDATGNWQLWFNGDVVDEGYIWCCEEQGYGIYMCSTLGRFMNGGGIGMDDNKLYIGVNGLDFCFDYQSLDGWEGGHWQGAEDFELYHRDISEFEGTWYYDNDPSAESYIMIDGDGNWSFYQHTLDDPEAMEIDCGTFSCSTDESAVYYADSAMNDGVSFRVFEFDEGIIIWDDKYVYYRID